MPDQHPSHRANAATVSGISKICIANRDACRERSEVRFQRTLLGVGGELAGVFAGGTLGYALAGDCNSMRENCEWHGFGELLIGSVIGGIVGSASGAAIPQGFGTCSRGRRFRRAAIGSFLGAAIALATVAAELETLALPVLVLAPPMTAAYALKRC